MSKSKAFENDLLKLIFNAETIAGLATNVSGGASEQLYVALHTASPGEQGTQSTNEVRYTGYARVPVSRDDAGWVVTENSVSPVNAIEFGEMTGGNPGTATHASIGMQSSGGGKVLYYGTLNPSIAFNEGVVPRIRTTSTITED